MSLPDSIISELSRGVARRFADWPDRTVPVFGAGVYTIWDNDGRFIYVGMSGRGITAETVRRNSPLGIYTRLHSHASGRRSDRVLCLCRRPACLTDAIPRRHQRHRFGASPDGCIRARVHLRKSLFSVRDAPDGAAAYNVEATIKNGDWEHGRPLLNPRK